MLFGKYRFDADTCDHRWAVRVTPEPKKLLRGQFQFGGKDKDGHTYIPLAHIKAAVRRLGKSRCKIDPRISEMYRMYRDFRTPPKGGDYDERLYPFQRTGTDFMLARLREFGTVLNLDEMGLGKTVQALQAAVTLKQDGVIDRVFVIAPKTILRKWEEEIYDWAGVDQRVSWLTAGKKYKGDVDFVLANYAYLGKIVKRLSDEDMTSKDLFIFDEIHYIKNIKAKRTIAADILSQKGYRIGMTGTPVKQSLMDIPAILYFGGLEQFSSPKTFKDTYFYRKNHRFIPKPVMKDDLEERISRVAIGRKLKDVGLELPDIIEDYIPVDLGTRQREAYDLMGHETIEQLMQSTDTDNILTTFLRLQQVCSGVWYEDDERVFHVKENAKLEALDNLISEAPEEQWVIWGQFQTEVEGIAEHLGSRATFVHGGIVGDERHRRHTQLGGKYQFLVATPKTLGTGINITQARRQIFFSPGYSDADTQQAMKRLHRIGQTKTVFAYHLMARGTIDRHVSNLRKMKGTWNNDVINALVAGKMVQ